MKQKINQRLVLVSILVSLMTMVCTLTICYRVFQKQIQRDLSTAADIISAVGVEATIGDSRFLDEDKLRITWIASDGAVLYDNVFSAEAMPNHLQRPEVQQALSLGVGSSVRESDTMNLRTYYYARMQQDGSILRVSTEARSLLSVFLQVIPIMLLLMACILLLCVLLSKFLTKQLLLPIEKMAESLDATSSDCFYSELSPFVLRIREQHENILAAAKNRQDFTASVSHELKTPLTAISGYAELIENQMVDEERQIKFAGDIRRNADRLVTMINDIIRLSELDYKDHYDFENVKLYETAGERVELLRSVAEQKNIRLELNGDKELEVLSNRTMLMELLDNLIQNAIRYNVPGGFVKVTTGKAEGRPYFEVSDSGIGIPLQEQERIFERFYRVDKSRSRDTGGTGLGLAIVKHIVEIHEGSIALESEVGKGTTIRICF